MEKKGYTTYSNALFTSTNGSTIDPVSVSTYCLPTWTDLQCCVKQSFVYIAGRRRLLHWGKRNVALALKAGLKISKRTTYCWFQCSGHFPWKMGRATERMAFCTINYLYCTEILGYSSLPLQLGHKSFACNPRRLSGKESIR